MELTPELFEKRRDMLKNQLARAELELRVAYQQLGAVEGAMQELDQWERIALSEDSNGKEGE